jgi:hypothetical protein
MKRRVTSDKYGWRVQGDRKNVKGKTTVLNLGARPLTPCLQLRPSSSKKGVRFKICHLRLRAQ